MPKSRKYAIIASMKKIIPIVLGLAAGCEQPEPVSIEKAEGATCGPEQTLMDVAYDTNQEIAEQVDSVLETRSDLRDPMLNIVVDRDQVEASGAVSETVQNALPEEYQWFGLISYFGDSEIGEVYSQLGYEDGSYIPGTPESKTACSDGTFGVTLEEVPISVVGQCNWNPREENGVYSAGNCVGNFYKACPLDITDPTSSTEDCKLIGTFHNGETSISYLLADLNVE